MTEIAAAMGLTNLERLNNFVAINRSNYHQYRSVIRPIADLKMLDYDDRERNNFQYVVLDVAPGFPVSRDRLIEILHAEGVLARRYFWPGCHNMQPYRSLYPHAGLVLSNTKLASERVVVLPTGSAMHSDTINGIASILQTVACGAV